MVPLYPVDVALVASVGMTRCPVLFGILLMSFNCSPIRGCRLGSFGRNDAGPPHVKQSRSCEGLRIAVEQPPRVPHMCGRRRRRMQNLSQGGGRRRNSPMGR